MKEFTKQYINGFFEEKKELEYLKEPITQAIEVLADCARRNKKILTCGNGGSAADSEHIAGELLKSFVLKRKIDDALRNKLIDAYGEDGVLISDNIQGGIKCIPLTSFCAFNTAFLNDCNEKLLYAQGVNALGDAGDVLIGISTSGNSKNVNFAAQLARVKGMKVIALTGESGGKLKENSDVLINTPSNIAYKIQEFHSQIYHLICLALEQDVFG